MHLTRHQTETGPRWAVDGAFLPPSLTLSALLELRQAVMWQVLATLPRDEPAPGDWLAPIEALHEVWAAGVTYLRSREARRVESASADVYDRVYLAERPELFFKAAGWRAV
jgi:2-dehydro-3-deoxy-D-arabinonate dehydratase